MNDQLRQDIRKRPDIFWISDPLTAPEIQRFTDQHDTPADLLDFWTEFGAGLMFESELILRPFAEFEGVELITAQEAAKGLPSHLTAFHMGIYISGFDSDGFEVYEIESYKFVGRFFRLDDWYVETLRSEFADRYELVDL